MRLPRNTLVLLTVDLALVLLAGWLAFWLRFNFDIPAEFDRLALRASPWCVAGYAAGLMPQTSCHASKARSRSAR